MKQGLLLPSLSVNLSAFQTYALSVDMRHAPSRFHRFQVMEGDAVTVEMSPFDLTKGRIVFPQLGIIWALGESKSWSAPRDSLFQNMTAL